MTPAEVVEFMSEGSRTGKLAVVRRDGSPHVVPVWFDFDPETGDVMFVTGGDSLKARCMRRDPRVSICVDVMEMPFAFARVDGVAEITTHSEDPSALRRWATETCRRYVGEERAVEFGVRNSDPGEVLVRVTPTRHVGAFGITD